MKRKIVEIIATDKRYMENTYPFRPIFDETINTYLTGQHISTDPKTKGNLTLQEMLGEVILSEEKRSKFPYVINPSPDNVFPLFNRRKFDLSTNDDGTLANPKDAAEFQMFSEHSWMVAKKRSAVRLGKDYFYINDVEADAKDVVSKEDMIYDALKFIREECSMERYKEIALLLNYKIKAFHINVDKMSDVLVRSKLYEACKTHPEVVLSCKLDGSNEDLFILKAAAYGIIKRVGEDYYDGPMFIGKGLSGAKAFLSNPEKAMYVGKWKTLIDEAEGRTDINDKVTNKTRDELRGQYEGLAVEDLKKICGSKKFRKLDWENYETREELIEYLISKVK